jgi:molybdenum cofactor cytidylyltransferase
VKVRIGIVLAAGAGQRMGGSKALLLMGGVPLVRAHVDRMIEAGCDRVVVVTRPDAALKLGEIARVTMVVAETASQAESLQLGTKKIGKRGEARVLVTPVDAPPVTVATIKALFAALDHGSEVATPHTNAGKGGHPVACRATVLTAAYGGKEAPTFRDVLAKHEAARARVEVDDARVGLDLDGPEDVVALTGEPPRFL